MGGSVRFFVAYDAPQNDTIPGCSLPNEWREGGTLDLAMTRRPRKERSSADSYRSLFVYSWLIRGRPKRLRISNCGLRICRGSEVRRRSDSSGQLMASTGPPMNGVQQ